MSAVLSSHGNDFGARLAFQKQLQVVTNKIHATSNVDEIMLEMSAEKSSTLPSSAEMNSRRILRLRR